MRCILTCLFSPPLQADAEKSDSRGECFSTSAAAADHGHVLRCSGPPPTGKRWCNNGVALRFIPRSAGKPVIL